MLYPIGIQDFESIRNDGYVYVDKTGLIYKMASTGKYYFLSRPRRFGKSLLVSTMEAYFSGRKDLFEGLAVAGLEQDWTGYPVLHLDLSGKSYDTPEVLDKVFDDCLSRWEETYGSVNRSDVPGIRFGNVVEAACRKTGRRVVILIDEYDKPLVDNLGDDELTETFRRRLQGFYSVMKGKDGFIQFGFLTGVSKLGRLSVFSGLNNLEDISMDARYADICGISEQDLRKYFGESVVELARANGLSEEECYARLAEMYDGYHFHPRSEGVYNPFSVLNTFKSLEFRKYWFSTGTPSFLVRYLEQGNYRLDNLAACRASEQDLSGVNARRPQVITLLYQTGYLTIKDYNPRTDR
ncbi:MAG: AAA family ATPase, partial [Bacteroidales bacterium]|nr:AAA family ATPase [Bacteroidales bacterium]